MDGLSASKPVPPLTLAGEEGDMSPTRTPKQNRSKEQMCSLRANGQHATLGSSGDTPMVLFSYRKDESYNRILHQGFSSCFKRPWFKSNFEWRKSPKSWRTGFSWQRRIRFQSAPIIEVSIYRLFSSCGEWGPTRLLPHRFVLRYLMRSLQPFHPNLVIISSSTVRLQVSFRLPFFLLPSGFQVNATLIWLLNSLLNICSIYLQRLSRVASLTVLVLLRRYSSSIEIFIGHLILTIFFMNIRWNLSSLSPSVPVILHRSAPYSRTGITLLWNKRSFVFRRYDSDFHTFQRILKEFLAFESLSMLSASAPPSSIAVDPR